MSEILIACAAILAVIFAPRVIPDSWTGPRRTVAVSALRMVFAIVAIYEVLATSIISIPANQVGVVRKIYGFSNIAPGRFIAAHGETGYQAAIIPPGSFRISIFFNVLNRVDELPVVIVPNGFYGRVVASDGEPLNAGQIMADAWPEGEFQKYLDAEYFLTHGGQKGLQLSVLKPGLYPLNLALFQVKIGYIRNGKDNTVNNDDIYDLRGLTHEDTPLDTSITRVPAGSVGVVRSSVQSIADCKPRIAKTEENGLTAELSPQFCKGVWDTSLAPNDYYLNRDAYDVTPVSTRVTTLEFKGGFTRRYLDLKVDSKGDFTQSERTASFPQPKDAVDGAINTKIEGWEIPQELRAIVQITPENAPIVVAAVGGQDEVDQRILVPSIRSLVRNVYGGTITVMETPPDGGPPRQVTRPTRVLDTIENRTVLEQAILERAQADGRRAGVDIKEIRLGESTIPPELLLARQREQLAGQLRAAYMQEQIAQEQRQKTENARATADQQRDLVTAKIGVQTAELAQERRRAEGHAERLYLEEQAAGQTAQAEVLGKDSVLKLQQLKLVLDLLALHPELVANLKLPQVIVGGGGSGLEGAAAVLGSFMQPKADGK
jgi:hypothetical protein